MFFKQNKEEVKNKEHIANQIGDCFDEGETDEQVCAEYEEYEERTKKHFSTYLKRIGNSDYLKEIFQVK